MVLVWVVPTAGCKKLEKSRLKVSCGSMLNGVGVPIFLPVLGSTWMLIELLEVQPDEESVQMTKLMLEEDILGEKRDPSSSFANFVEELKCGSSHFSRPLQVDDCEKFDPLKACEYFNSCFKDPSNFTVVLVGNFDLAIAFPHILQYLGGIPRSPEQVLNFKRDELTDLPFTFPSTVVRWKMFT
ncbi:zinc protease PQQL-like isoform X1 [Henckelia pumila]|uniref:zinc protease PQQL-like isoform X1 n=1 Tax=Henckelia pumila TaxID=405737 RepID=UPI003C6E906F